MIIWNFLNQHLTDWVVLFIPVCPLSLGACLGLSLVWNWKWMLRENTQGGLGGGGWGVGGRPKFQILFTENHTGNCNLHCGTARGVKAYCLAGQCFTMWDRGSQIKLTEIICSVYSLFGVCGFLDFGIIWHVVLLPSLNLILLLPIYVKGVDLIPCSEFPGRHGGVFVLYIIFSWYCTDIW